MFKSSIFEFICLDVDLVVLYTARYVFFHSWQILKGCDSVYLAEVYDNCVREVYTFHSRPECRFLKVIDLVACTVSGYDVLAVCIIDVPRFTAESFTFLVKQIKL